MGLDNREYLRDESARWSGGGGGGAGRPSFGSHAPMCRNLLFITIGVFILQIFSVKERTQEELQVVRDKRVIELRQLQKDVPDPDGQIEAEIQYLENAEELTPGRLQLLKKYSIVQNWLQLDTPKVFSGQIWRLITSAFCHAREDVMHILFNMLFLWWFGPRLEAMYGSKEFLLFYLCAAMVASVAYIGIDLVTGDPAPMIGASGAIMAVLMLYALHFPTQTIYIMFVLPLEIRWVVVIYAIFDVYPLLMQLSGEDAYDNVAHAAHLGGLAFGYFYGKRQFRLLPFWSGVETWWKARRRGFKVVGSAPASGPSRKSQKLADEMDAILKKISEKGEASLSAAERKTLERASRELRDRRQ